MNMGESCVMYHKGYQPVILQVNTHKLEFVALIHGRILLTKQDLDD